MGDQPKDGSKPDPVPKGPSALPRPALPRPPLPLPPRPLPRAPAKQTLLGGSPKPPPTPPGSITQPDAPAGDTQPEAHDTQPGSYSRGPHGTDPAPDTPRPKISPTQIGGTPRRVGKSPFSSTAAFESPYAEPGASKPAETAPATPRGVAAPARPGAPRFGSTQAFESPPQPAAPTFPTPPHQAIGAPRRSGKSHLASTVAFEVDAQQLKESIEEAAGRAQATQPAASEEPAPDTQSFGRRGESARRGTVGPVRTGKSHLAQTVAFFTEDNPAAVQRKVDEAAARVGRIPGPAGPPPLPSEPAVPPAVASAAVIDVASGPKVPQQEHWQQPNAPSREAALKMKLLTSRKKTMIGGVKLLDLLEQEREAAEAQAAAAQPQAAPPAAPPPPPPAPPNPEASQPARPSNPLAVQRRGTMMGIGSQGQAPPGMPPAPPLGGPPPGMGPPPPPMGAPPFGAPQGPPLPMGGPPPLLEPSPGPFPVPQPPHPADQSYGSLSGSFGEAQAPPPVAPMPPGVPMPGAPMPPVAPMPPAFTPPPSSLSIPKKKTSVFLWVVLTIVVMAITAGATLFFLFLR